MRLPNLVHAVGSALLLALLSGCAPSDASTPPEPTATFVAPYATDEEALAAAEEAYVEYLRVTGALYSEGQLDPVTLSSVASGEHLDELIDEFEKLEADGEYILGEQTFDQMVLQRYSKDGSAREIIAVYLCDDLSRLSFYSDGSKLGPAEPLAPAQMQVVFDYSMASETLLVSVRDIWSNKPC